MDRVIPEVHSAIAIVGGPAAKQDRAATLVADQLGASLLNENEIDQIESMPIDVLVMVLNERSPSTFKDLQTKLTQRKLDHSSLNSQKLQAPRLILAGSQTVMPESDFLEIILNFSIFAWVDSLTDGELQSQVVLALDDARESRQSAESLALYLEHNESLLRLSNELEKRIEARRQELSESSLRLQMSQRRNELMHRALNAVHLSHSIPEIEKHLVSNLHPHQMTSGDGPGVEWVKIAFASLNQLESAPLDTTVAKSALSLSSVFSAPIGTLGHIHFGRSGDRPFRSDDRNFLTPIAEAVALAVTRLQSVERMDQVKREWEETFNAIVDPVAVLDEHLRFVRGNRALLRGRPPEELVGKPCYEAVFSRSTPCPQCQLYQGLVPNTSRRQARQFRVTSENTFEVSSRPIEPTYRTNRTKPASVDAMPAEQELMVHLYRDVSTTARFERRILESSKMAELGTIGSSIAHQLNNPIGGMLSHIQLLLMDLDPKSGVQFEGKEELRLELKEMEAGTRRCAQIVRDLLGFSRRGVEDAASDHDLGEILEQAVKITELQTRSRGIRFKIQSHFTDANPPMIHGRFNLMAQAIRAVLLSLLPAGLRDTPVQIAISPAIGLAGANSNIEIKIEVPQSEEWASPEKLDLTMAEQILEEHQGKLQLSRNDRVQQATLSLPATKVGSP